jgi:hypothetical protein
LSVGDLRGQALTALALIFAVFLAATMSAVL